MKCKIWGKYFAGKFPFSTMVGLFVWASCLSEEGGACHETKIATFVAFYLRATIHTMARSTLACLSWVWIDFCSRTALICLGTLLIFRTFPSHSVRDATITSFMMLCVHQLSCRSVQSPNSSPTTDLSHLSTTAVERKAELFVTELLLKILSLCCYSKFFH